MRRKITRSPHKAVLPGDGKQRLQMSDIARIAGVSTATVSRALNQSTLVKAETRKRVTEIAKSLNYTINVSAKNLRLQQNRTIAVVLPYDASTRQDVSDPFFLTMLGSIADALTERGYDMLLSRIDATQLERVADLCSTGRVVGVILIGQWRHHDQLNELARRRVPLVVWGAQLSQQQYCVVGSDNVEGGRLATEHLLTGGRRRIAFLGDTTLPEVAQRHDGYIKALTAHGVRPVPALSVPATFLADSARRAVQDLMARKIDFDGIFACSDLLAINAISTLRTFELRVPDDVAVVGYDDIEMAAHSHPPLTTIRQPIDSGGRALVDALFAVIEGGRAKTTVLRTELVTRGTSPVARPARRQVRTGT